MARPGAALALAGGSYFAVDEHPASLAPQGRGAATGSSRTSRTPSRGTAVVCRTPRFASSTSATRRRAWTRSPTAATSCRGRRSRFRLRRWRLRAWPRTSTWLSTPARTLSTCASACTPSTCCATTRCLRAPGPIGSRRACVAPSGSPWASRPAWRSARCCFRSAAARTSLAWRPRRCAAPSSSSRAARRWCPRATGASRASRRTTSSSGRPRAAWRSGGCTCTSATTAARWPSARPTTSSSTRPASPTCPCTRRPPLAGAPRCGTGQRENWPRRA